MSDTKLFQWINDSEAFEMMGSYHVRTLPIYEFQNRQDDFYITLLNRMFFLLDDVEDNNYSSIEEELKEIAKGLLVYSDNETQQEFDSVDKDENHLYVAAIYYLIGYEAVATVLLKGKNYLHYANKYAQTLCFLLMGGYDKNEQDNVEEHSLVWYLSRYLSSGNDKRLYHVIKEVKESCDQFRYDDLDEFFDSHMLLHVLNKYSADNLWHDLRRFDLGIDWGDYVIFSRQQGVLQFLKSQRDAINKGLLTFEHSFSLKMPTSAGKSYITELLVFCEIRKNPDAKILYLAPLRSLSHELKQRYDEVGKALGFECYAAYGGNSSTLNKSKLDAASLFITTPEFFSSMEGGDEAILDDYTLVICDEGQLLDSVSRGIHYELLLSRIKKHGTARFLFISAIIPNIYEVNTWLGGEIEQVGDSTYRPCEIKLAIAERKKKEVCLNVYNRDYSRVKFSIDGFLNKEENKSLTLTTKKTLSAALGLKASTAGSALIFVYAKKKCQPICEEVLRLNQMHRFGEQLLDDKNGDDIIKLFEYVAYQYGAGYPLSNYIRYGLAYHNGALPQDVREYIEDYYRKKKIKLLVSNSTLAEGVNLPIRTLIVYSLANYNPQKNRHFLIDSTEIRNILGRVGRAGREKYGLVILPEYNQKLVDKIVPALKGEGIHDIRGIFYELIQQIREYGRDLTDAELNMVMERISASTAIDTMLLRNYNLGNEADVVESSISDSLAYHLSDNASKGYIRRAYSVRYHKVSQNIKAEKIGLLKQTGLDVDDFVVLDKIEKEEFEMRLNSDTMSDGDFLKEMYSIIYSLPSLRRIVDEINDGDEKDAIYDSDSWIKIVTGWLEGSQYHQIAESVDLPIDIVMNILGHVQYHFCIRLQGLVRLLTEKYSIENWGLNMLSDFLRYGICRDCHAAMIKSGLDDRIALHMIGRYIHNHQLIWTSHSGLRRALRMANSELVVFLINQGIPQLSLKKVKKWLRI